MRCNRCNGLMITERVFAESDWIWETHCLNCGECICPPENEELRQLNKLVIWARERTQGHRGYTIYGNERRENHGRGEGI